MSKRTERPPERDAAGAVAWGGGEIETARGIGIVSERDNGVLFIPPALALTV